METTQPEPPGCQISSQSHHWQWVEFNLQDLMTHEQKESNKQTSGRVKPKYITA